MRPLLQLLTLAATAAPAAATAPTHRLYGYGLIDGGSTTQIALISTVDAAVTWSAPFLVASTDQGCNVAFGIDGPSGAPAYFVPDGSQFAPAGAPYVYHTVAVNGSVLRTVPASQRYSSVFIGYDPASQRAYGLGSLPASGPFDPTVDLFDFSPATGATATLAANLSWVQEMPSCVGAATGAGDGAFYFVNGLISHTQKQALVAFDVRTRSVREARVYDSGLISAIATYSAPNGSALVLALLWPQPVGAAALVALNGSEHKWRPTLLHSFTGGETPQQGAMTVVGDTVYALMKGAGAAGDLLLVADLAGAAPSVRLLPIDLSHAPFGVWALGGLAE